MAYQLYFFMGPIVKVLAKTDWFANHPKRFGLPAIGAVNESRSKVSSPLVETPLNSQNIDDHKMHSEFYNVPENVIEACAQAERVIAVGTTTVRALETAALGKLEGRTNIFIKRPFDFKIVDLLLTNFHLPRSTLLVMLDAFLGERWQSLYQTL